MSEIQLEWGMVPAGWALCFNPNCPLRDTCLRYQAGLLVPQDVTVARCVTPRAVANGQIDHAQLFDGVADAGIRFYDYL